MGVPWHSKRIEEVLSELGITLSGLSSGEADERRRRSGSNAIVTRKPRSNVAIFLSQFQSPLIIILFVAAAVSFLFKEVTDGWIVLGVVLFNGVVGFFQERRAGQAMERLRSLTPQIVRVLRDGEERELPVALLVPGDVVVLETGAAVPADGRIAEAVNLKINEAIFTGESVPVEKNVDPLLETTAVFERKNMAWRGTTVVAGRGRLIITEVGMSTRFGKIVQEVSEIAEPSTPFQRKIASFAKRLALVIVALSAATFLLSVARTFPIEQSILLAISLVVSLIPEGLPVIITLTFAWGMWRMAKRRALIRKLVAVETLGSITVIASDKTGTLTFGEMMVEEVVLDHRTVTITGEGYRTSGDFFEHERRIAPLEDAVLRQLFEVGMLDNDSRLSHDEQGRVHWIGDPTEISLAVLGEKAGLKRDDVERAYPRVGEFPFDFKLKYMVTFHSAPNGKHLIAVKGAPRQILELCTRKLTPDGIRSLSDTDRAEVRDVYERMATRSLRGLCLAFAETPLDWRSVTHENLSEHLVYLGLVGIRDPIRPEARETVDAARNAGVRVMMLTGDYRITAVTVAREVGILHRDDYANVVDGSELDTMPDQELSERLKNATVFSRVTPEQKLRIARLLKANGEVVAMTGDGINDVPALTEANIGVAIGMASSDAAKEVSEMVLTDGNLSSIIAAVEEGRVVFRNIQRVLIYLLASNLGELFLILAAIFGGFPLPLLPLHIIWLNAITDPFLGIALAREPKGPHVMSEPPRSPRAPVLIPKQWARIVLDGSAIAIGSFVIFLIALSQQRSSAEVFALTLTTVALGEWFVGVTSRSARRSVFSNIHTNRLILLALVIVVAMQVSILYVPQLASAFHITSLSFADWIMVLAASLFVVVVEEVRKTIARRRPHPQQAV